MYLLDITKPPPSLDSEDSVFTAASTSCLTLLHSHLLNALLFRPLNRQRFRTDRPAVVEREMRSLMTVIESEEAIDILNRGTPFFQIKNPRLRIQKASKEK